MSTSEIATVLAWHDALSASDIATLVSLSSDDIEIGDAHGARQGYAALREWARNPLPRSRWVTSTTATASSSWRSGSPRRAIRRRHHRRVGVPRGARSRHLGLPA